jgi:cell division protein FtsQ
MLLVALVLVALGVLGGWVLLGSSLLGVSGVAVEGTSRVPPGQVLDVAAIKSGTPLARLDTAAVAARVAALPAVRTVDVRRSWPRAVSIVVRERVPAAVRVHGTGFVLVDRSGVAFAEVTRRPKDLPLVTAPIGAGAPALRSGLDVLGSVPASVRGQVRTVFAALAHQRPHGPVGDDRARRTQGRGARRAALAQGDGLRRQRTGRAHHPQVARHSTSGAGERTGAGRPAVADVAPRPCNSATLHGASLIGGGRTAEQFSLRRVAASVVESDIPHT